VGKDVINPGDEVVIWGNSPRGTVQVLDIADKIGTIPYELTCGVSNRVKRVYVGER
jgi:alanine racemase